MKNSATIKNNNLTRDIVEWKIDINNLYDGPQGEIPLVVKKEELVVGEPRIELAQIDQSESSSMQKLRNAAQRQSSIRYNTWFDSSVIDDIEVDVDNSGDAFIIEDGHPSFFFKSLASSEKQN